MFKLKNEEEIVKLWKEQFNSGYRSPIMEREREKIYEEFCERILSILRSDPTLSKSSDTDPR